MIRATPSVHASIWERVRSQCLPAQPFSPLQPEPRTSASAVPAGWSKGAGSVRASPLWMTGRILVARPARGQWR